MTDDSLPPAPLRRPRARRQERPPRFRERLARYGAAALDDHELLAVLLGTGHPGESAETVARALLDDAGSLSGLRELGVDALSAHPGIGLGKAARVSAGLELGLRLASGRRPVGPRLRGGRDVDALLRPKLAHEEVEHFLVLALDAQNRPRAEVLVARGGRNSCSVHPAEAFKPLVRRGSLAAILVHNHPSGDPSPSPEDVALTRRMVAAGRLLGVAVLDHVIVASEGYYSFLEAGVLEELLELPLSPKELQAIPAAERAAATFSPQGIVEERGIMEDPFDSGSPACFVPQPFDYLTWRFSCEAHLPAEPDPPQAGSRFPGTDEDQGRPRRPDRSPRQGP